MNRRSAMKAITGGAAGVVAAPSSLLASPDSLADATRLSLRIPAYARALIGCRARYISLRGGRSSSKTWTTARLLVLRAFQERTVIACGREFQKSLAESAKPAIENAIKDMGLHGFFTVTDRFITGANGSRFFFAGYERNRESIRGWEDVDIVWSEEAQRLSTATAELLIPTIRKPGSQLWFTWNPTRRTDWVWRRFMTVPRPNDVSLLVNWRDNPFFPAEANEERLTDQKVSAARYRHIWEGEPDDGGAASQVLPYALLRECVNAYRKGLHKGTESRPVAGPKDVGLDVADNEAGGDWNAAAYREGPVLREVERWRGRAGKTAKRGHAIAVRVGAWGLRYDAGGVGAGCREFFDDLRLEVTQRPDYDPQAVLYEAVPEQFGAGVKGGERRYAQRADNAGFFSKRNMQMAWGLRLRAERTVRLMEGEDIDLLTCLFIPHDLPDLEGVLGELSQPTYTENPVTGKLVLDKTPDGEPSPDRADAVFLAYGRDSEYGLVEEGTE